MIEVQRLTKTYGSVTAVHDVSFEVGAHEVVGFLGPNGAGKTTTLRMIVGFLGATRGSVTVDGIDIVQDPLRARARIGYMPENVPLYPELRVSEYLRFRAQIKKVPRKQREDAIVRAMRDVRVDDHASVIIGQLSKGYRQRVGLADAILARPPVLVLDEPMAGLDPNQIREVRDLIRSLAEDHAVLLSTHIMSEVESTCDRALVIHRGRLVAQGSLEALRKLRRARATRFVLRGDDDTAERVLSDLDGARNVERMDDEGDVMVWEVRWATKKADPAERTEHAVQALVEAGVRVRSAAPAKTTLEEIFALVTARDAGDDSDDTDQEAS